MSVIFKCRFSRSGLIACREAGSVTVTGVRSPVAGAEVWTWPPGSERARGAHTPRYLHTAIKFSAAQVSAALDDDTKRYMVTPSDMLEDVTVMHCAGQLLADLQRRRCARMAAKLSGKRAPHGVGT